MSTKTLFRRFAALFSVYLTVIVVFHLFLFPVFVRNFLMSPDVNLLLTKNFRGQFSRQKSEIMTKFLSDCEREVIVFFLYEVKVLKISFPERCCCLWVRKLRQYSRLIRPLTVSICYLASSSFNDSLVLRATWLQLFYPYQRRI